MLIYLHGPDSFRAHETIQKFREKFLRDVDPSGVNITRLDGKGLTAGAFRRAITAGGFLATKRLVIVRDAVANASAAAQKELVDVLKRERGVRDHLIVFWDVSSDTPMRRGRADAARSTGVLAAFLAKTADHTYAFPRLTGARLQQWITHRVQAQGSVIAQAAVRELAERSGGDLWQIANDAGKLVAYATGRTITPADVQLFVAAPTDDNVFHLLDAVGVQDRRLALRQCLELQASGMSEHAILAQLVRQFRILLQIADRQHRGAAVSAESLGLHPFVYQKSAQQARRFTVGRLTAIYGALLDADRRLKQSTVDASTVLVRLVTAICTEPSLVR